MIFFAYMGYLLLVPIFAAVFATSRATSRPAVPRQGRKWTKYEAWAMASTLLITPAFFFLGIMGVYLAFVTVPLFGALQGVIVAAMARTTRPLQMAFLGSLPFAALILTLACMDRYALARELPYILTILAIVLVLPLLFALPMYFKVRQQKPPLGA